MNLHKLIFSQSSPTKYYRHILFWLIIFLLKFHSDTQDYNIGTQLIDMAYCYTVVYWVVPKFLIKRRTALFISWLFGITILVYVIRGIFYLSVYDFFAQGLNKMLYAWWFHTTLFIHSGPIMRTGLFITCKVMKDYYRKVKQKETLIKETNVAELQLLKAQVQPHFLFNTLNNIYSFTLNKSPFTAELVLKLHDTINYMNLECQSEVVSLPKELKMIQDYIDLEKIRYGQRLAIEVSTEGQYENKLIAPLLLIPFVENSFKHGASKVLEHPWIRMNVIAYDDLLDFELSNSKPETIDRPTNRNGIGLNNVQKRLRLLFGNDFSLKIDETLHSFHVHLKLPIHKSEFSSN